MTRSGYPKKEGKKFIDAVLLLCPSSFLAFAFATLSVHFMANSTTESL